MQNNLWNNLHKAYTTFNVYLDDALRPLKITIQQLSLMEILLDGPMNVTVIAEMIGVDRTTISRNAKRLMLKGLIELDTITDKRCSRYSLTEKGNVITLKARAHCADYLKSLDVYLKDNHMEFFPQYLEKLFLKMREHLSK